MDTQEQLISDAGLAAIKAAAARDAMRLAAIRAVDGGVPIAIVARSLRVTRQTVQRWSRAARQEVSVKAVLQVGLTVEAKRGVVDAGKILGAWGDTERVMHAFEAGLTELKAWNELTADDYAALVTAAVTIQEWHRQKAEYGVQSTTIEL